MIEGKIIAEGLRFPEGPVWADAGLYFTEIAAGRVSRWTPERGVERIADTGGGPNGATLGADGALYVTQNGGWVRRPENRVPAAIQRVASDGNVSVLATGISGLKLDAPNDLAFGPDGRLYFTDPRGEPDPVANRLAGRLFAYDLLRGTGELLLETGPVYPNGVAFSVDGVLYWSESFSRRVMRLGANGAELVIELPERHNPDGFCFGADGRLYVASTYAHCVSVIEDARIVERYLCGDGMVTNCCFGGTDLYVTESRRGTLWRFSVGATGLPLHTGKFR